MKINKLLVSGGVHGNEYTGIYIINRLKKYPLKTKTLEIIPLLSNPEAFKLSKRYKDQDLNRSFSTHDLNNPSLNTYEDKRAREINQTYGSKSDSPADFLVDFHTTTSNIGKTIITDGKSPFVNKLCRYLIEQIDGLRIIKHQGIVNQTMNNIIPMSLTIEIGAVSTSIYDPKAIEITTEIFKEIVKFIEMSNSDDLPEIKNGKAYQVVKEIAFPRDEEGSINGVIHNNINGNDFKLISETDPAFELMDGSIQLLNEPGKWYPIFVNESAYYEKNIAFYLTKEIDF